MFSVIPSRPPVLAELALSDCINPAQACPADVAHPSSTLASSPATSSILAIPPTTYSRAAMRSLKLYEHPDFTAEEDDISLFTTICFVLTLAMTGAIIILSMSCILLWDDCSTCEYLRYSSYTPSLIALPAYPIYAARPHILTVQQILKS